MSYTGILKQAQLADKIGNYKLADILTNKLIKIAKSNPAKVFLDALDLKKVVVDAVGGAKKTIRQVAEESTSSLIVMYRKSATKADALKIIDDLGLSPRTKNALIKNLDAGDEKAIAQLNRIFEAKYQAMADAGYKVDPPKTDGPKPPEGPKPGDSPAPKPDESVTALRLEEISKNFKGSKEELIAELKKLNFTDEEIRAAGIIEADGKVNIINVNKLINNATPERLILLENKNNTIIFGGRPTSLSGMTFAQLTDLLKRADELNPQDVTTIINKIKIQLKKDPNLVVPVELQRYFDVQFHSPRPPKPEPTKPDPSAPTTPGSTADEAAEGASNTNWKAWAAKASVAVLAAYGLYKVGGTIMSYLTGKPATDAEGNAAMNSAGAGAGSQFKSKSDMYEQRMRTNPNQQMMKGSKPQEFVDANKGKYKTQREFYEAAKAAGDDNFANSVIAIVKKDLDLFVSDKDQRKF